MEAGVTMAMAYNSRDIEANKRRFRAMGGPPAVKNGNFDIVKFPGSWCS